MVSVGIVLVHGRKVVASKCGPGAGEARLRGVLLVGAGRGRLVAERAHLVRELVRRHVVAAGVAAPEAARVVQIVVLELDEGGLAALGDGRAAGAVGAVAPGRARGARAEAPVVQVVHLGRGAGAAGRAGAAAAVGAGAGATSASTGRRAAARHAVRGRSARRTGVARPEWAPQIREIERRRAAWTLHLCRDKVAPHRTVLEAQPRGSNFETSRCSLGGAALTQTDASRRLRSSSFSLVTLQFFFPQI